MKTYIECRNCKFYKICHDWSYLPNQNSGTDRHTFCMYPDNIRCRVQKQIIFKSAPSVININHDCAWYQKKECVNTYVWEHDPSQTYKDHGVGTYNINPVNGVKGVYIGEKNLEEIIKETAGGGESGLEPRVHALEVKVVEHDSGISQLIHKTDVIESEVDNLNVCVIEHTSMIQDLSEKVEKGIIEGKTLLDGGSSVPRPDVD